MQVFEVQSGYAKKGYTSDGMFSSLIKAKVHVENLYAPINITWENGDGPLEFDENMALMDSAKLAFCKTVRIIRHNVIS